MPAMLAKSQFSRRLSGIPESVWRGLTKQLAMPSHEMNSLKIYLADSFPVPVCRNIRIRQYIRTNASGEVFQAGRNIFTG
ncbi:MAG: hypothetical protein ACTFAK_11505 [Candidatus Electronema sp. VV]